MSGEWLAEPDADLHFDVSRVPDAQRFDSPSHGVETLKKVDFLFHWPEERLLWLVEVKDPDNPIARAGNRERLVEEFKSKALVHHSLAPKAKDSFLYLLLEDRIPPGTTIDYLVLFACEDLPPAKRAKYFRKAAEELKRHAALGGPHGQPWRRADLYLRSCLILSLSEWNEHLRERVPVRRTSSTGVGG